MVVIRGFTCVSILQITVTDVGKDKGEVPRSQNCSESNRKGHDQAHG